MVSRMRIWKIATLLFGALLALIVLLANQGFSFRLVYALPGGDKTAHFLLMGSLAFLANMALRGSMWRYGRLALPLGGSAVAALVTLEEMSQFFIPTRTLSLGDLLADYAGILLLGGLALWLQRRPARSR